MATYITGYQNQITFEVTSTAITKTGGNFPFTVYAGSRDYDAYYAMFAAQDAGIIANESEWKKAAIAYQYGYSHWLLDEFKQYSPMTYTGYGLTPVYQSPVPGEPPIKPAPIPNPTPSPAQPPAPIPNPVIPPAPPDPPATVPDLPDLPDLPDQDDPAPAPPAPAPGGAGTMGAFIGIGAALLILGLALK